MQWGWVTYGELDATMRQVYEARRRGFIVRFEDGELLLSRGLATLEGEAGSLITILPAPLTPMGGWLPTPEVARTAADKARFAAAAASADVNAPGDGLQSDAGDAGAKAEGAATAPEGPPGDGGGGGSGGVQSRGSAPVGMGSRRSSSSSSSGGGGGGGGGSSSSGSSSSDGHGFQRAGGMSAVDKFYAYNYWFPMDMVDLDQYPVIFDPDDPDNPAELAARLVGVRLDRYQPMLVERLDNWGWRMSNEMVVLTSLETTPELEDTMDAMRADDRNALTPIFFQLAGQGFCIYTEIRNPTAAQRNLLIRRALHDMIAQGEPGLGDLFGGIGLGFGGGFGGAGNAADGGDDDDDDDDDDDWDDDDDDWDDADNGGVADADNGGDGS